MCLGGGGGSATQTPQYLPRNDPPPGPASPPDMVEGTEMTNQSYYAGRGHHDNKTKLKAGIKSQSSKNTGLY